MNRANVGNIFTNGMQILSVGATTATRLLGRADTALNNLSPEERKAYIQMQADKMRDEVREYQTGGASPKQHMTSSELSDYQTAKAKDMNEYAKNRLKGDDEDDVDSIMEGLAIASSPQANELKTKMKKDIDNFDYWTMKKSDTIESIIEDAKKEGIV